MKFLHIADLHLGKSIYGLSLTESGDQKDWIDQFIKLCEEEKPDAVVIAGDVYDRSAPSGAAVELLDGMLTQLEEKNIPVLIVAGNHDSGQKLAFGQQVFAKQNIYIAGTVEKELKHVTLTDEYGPVTFWLMPYLFPEQVSRILEDDSIRSYDEAVRRLLAAQDIDFSKRNVLIAHQNVVANGKEAERGGSESMVGGVGEIDYTAFDGFDYVALGHIHSAYPVGRPEVRYAGTPLCYHFEETRQKKKGPLFVELKEKGVEPSITLKELAPLHKMRALEGTYEEVWEKLSTDDGRGEYLSITLTDQRISPEIAMQFRELLKARGSILMELVSSFQEYQSASRTAKTDAVAQKPMEDLFSDLFTERNHGTPPDDDTYALMQYIGELVRQTDPHEPADDGDAERILKFAGSLGGDEA